MKSGSIPSQMVNCSPVFVWLGPMGDNFRALLNEGAVKAGEITGHSYFDVMTKYWKLQSWGEYQTEHRQDHEPYPDEWVRIQRPFIDSM